jgi:ABC-type nickel/cobalt efflux system permease component RcnA
VSELAGLFRFRGCAASGQGVCVERGGCACSGSLFILYLYIIISSIGLLAILVLGLLGVFKTRGLARLTSSYYIIGIIHKGRIVDYNSPNSYSYYIRISKTYYLFS